MTAVARLYALTLVMALIGIPLSHAHAASGNTLSDSLPHPVGPPATLRQRDPTPQQAAGGIPVVECGTHFYDDGTSENALFFQGGGHAGETDHLFGVMFLLSDFGFEPGSIVITGFCAGNRFNFTAIGGPWPNEIFVYPDNQGAPNLDIPLRHNTMFTGDGSGDFIGTFDPPLLIRGDFWLANHGYPPHAGEDFNMETDQDSVPSERSYITDHGLPFLFQTEQNFILRAYLAMAPPARPVPALGSMAWLTLVVLLAGISYQRLRRYERR